MSEDLTVTLNGAERTFLNLGEKPTVSGIVGALGFREDRVALERNGEIIPRSEWATTPVLQGDRFEMVHFVGGGSFSPKM